MSVIVDFAIFPMDKGESLSPYVARAIKVINESGLPHKLHPMGSCIEGEWEEVIGVVTKCLKEMEKDCNRINVNFKADYRKGEPGRMDRKIESVESKL
ncbi:MAG TPA: MTH1187 family thiamine-binding protein [Deltaproteobacteria bacterium]|nr:MTH1187 family thiamine-binding protein [Deltaproteobacteria bacterium]